MKLILNIKPFDSNFKFITEEIQRKYLKIKKPLLFLFFLDFYY